LCFISSSHSTCLEASTGSKMPVIYIVSVTTEDKREPL
jgi:hypothetical protein